MDILITHGYLLTGTGSNLYVSNLVRNYCRKGHTVYLVSQDPDPLSKDYINRSFSFVSNNKELKKEGEKETLLPGKCFHFRPDLHGFLPVYVYDHYEGFSVKEFTDCSKEEIDQYINWNRSALKTVMSRFPVDVIQTNHTVMFPYIAASLAREYALPHFVTVHGSALNFTVKKDPRFLPFAKEGFESARKIIVDSLHAREELEEFLDKNEWSYLVDKIKIIPAGVDVNNFSITPRKEALPLLKESLLPGSENGRKSDPLIFEKLPDTAPELEKEVERVRQSYDYKQPDKFASGKLERIGEEDPVVLFVGKYLWTKGIYLELLAIPEILVKWPNTIFVFAGFGPFREPAEIMVNLLADAKIDELIQLADNSPLFRGEKNNELPLLKEILQSQKLGIKQACETLKFDLRERIIFTGIVDHDQLKYLLPVADVLVAPSVFPEAFGMVAVEAMAAGAFPVVTSQSAFKEIAELVTGASESKGLEQQKILLDPLASKKIANNVVSFFTWKSCNGEGAKELQEELRELAVKRFSWEGISKSWLETFNAGRKEMAGDQ